MRAEFPSTSSSAVNAAHGEQDMQQGTQSGVVATFTVATLARRDGRWRVRAAVFVCALLLATPAGVLAQRLTGSVTDATSREPIMLALVALVDSAGRVLQQVLTNESGRFVMTPAGTGRVRLRIERIGYTSAYEPFFELATDTERDFLIAIDVRPITLDAIAVTEERHCSISASASETLRVWTEARKALAAAAVAERQRLFRFSGVTFHRVTTEDGTISDQRTRPFMATYRQPFVSRPAADLMENGYVRSGGTGTDFFAPNAAVLLSPEFEQSNCFSLTRNTADADLIGVRFTPNRRHERSAIRGVVWLERRTARLRFVEFGYVNTGLRYGNLANGRVEFQMLPNGGWLVSRWLIRMPLNVREEVAGPRVVQFREDGGEVRLAIAGTAEWNLLGAGTIAGVAIDSTTGLPLRSAGVGVMGTALSARTNADGSFRIGNLPAGSYRLTVSHPRLDSLPPFTAETQAVTVAAGGTANIVFAVPPLERTALARCLAAMRPGSDRVAVYGIVRDEATGERVTRARLRLSWDSVFTAAGQFAATAHSFEADIDERGRYLACDVPARMTIHAELLARDRPSSRMEFHTGNSTLRAAGHNILYQPLNTRRSTNDAPLPQQARRSDRRSAAVQRRVFS
jgi:hypothetical protein